MINQDSPDYIKSWDEFTFIPRSLDAIRELTAHGFVVIVITNQSVIGRHLVAREALHNIHKKMKDSIMAAGGRIHDIFFCPHLPDDGCDCRKPKPGLIQQAQAKYQIELKAAAMVGDNAKDILCAQAAGCRHSILVKTGSGVAAQKTLSEKNIAFDYLANDLYDAVQWLLKACPNTSGGPLVQAKGQAEEQTP